VADPPQRRRERASRTSWRGSSPSYWLREPREVPNQTGGHESDEKKKKKAIVKTFN
jgi:hypothetical protein